VLANPAAQEISGSPERPDADAWPALLSEAGHQVTRVALHDPTGGPLGEAFTVAGARGDDGGDQLRQYASDIETLTEVGNILSELYQTADAALYGAKHGGRNRAVVADAGVKKAA
jgi:hypothetical protein